MKIKVVMLTIYFGIAGINTVVLNYFKALGVDNYLNVKKIKPNETDSNACIRVAPWRMKRKRII